MTLPAHVIGIDFGKRNLVLSFPPEVQADGPVPPARAWPTRTFDFKSKTWWSELVDCLDCEDADVVWEASAYKFYGAVLAVIQRFRPQARIWLVNTFQTQHYRESFVSSTKNDEMDARALCLIGYDLRAGKQVRHVQRFNGGEGLLLRELRYWVNRYERVTQDRVRNRNRLNQAGHLVWPGLSDSDTWHHTVKAGFVTPQQMKELIEMQPVHPAFNRVRLGHVHRLIKGVPEIETPDYVLDDIAALNKLRVLLEEEEAHVRSKIHTLIEVPALGEVTKRWRTIPGAGDIAIATFHIASGGKIQQMSKNQFRSAVGAAPNIGTSGGRPVKRTLRKGFRPAMRALHLWTMLLLGSKVEDNVIRAYYRRGHSFAATRNKLARVLWGVAQKADPVF